MHFCSEEDNIYWELRNKFLYWEYIFVLRNIFTGNWEIHFFIGKYVFFTAKCILALGSIFCVDTCGPPYDAKCWGKITVTIYCREKRMQVSIDLCGPRSTQSIE